MTGEKGALFAGLRAEALKSRHAAPVRLAVLMALPMPLLGAMPYRGVQIFSAWNYWYAPVSYTHLDVYKRQLLFRRSLTFNA